MTPEASNPDDPRADPPRDQTGLAGFQTQLALDRTMLAWIGTALAIGGFGFGTVGFFRTLEEKTQSAESVRLHAGAVHFGIALIILGIAATILSAVSHWLALRKLRQGITPVVTQWPLSITVALLLAVIGLGGLWALFAR
jgi:putative membrane protein